MPVHRSSLIALAVTIGFAAAGCERPATAIDPPAAPTTATATAADGVSIAYDDRGDGATALVFVHCWACTREFWHHQVAAFADEYRVVSLDLGGHGESGANRTPWTIEGLSGDVVAVADALKLERVILVGHSMGGPVSLAAARAMPGRVIGVIAADTLHDAAIELPDEQVQGMIAAFDADFPGTMAGMFSGMSGVSMDESLRDWIVTRASDARPEVATALLGDFARISLPELMAGAGVPIRAINAAPGPMTPPTNVDGNRRHADFDAVILDGVGHFLQLEAPERFNAHLRDTIVALDASKR